MEKHAQPIGHPQPVSVRVETFGTAKIADEKIAALINEYFDLRPGAIIRDLDLLPDCPERDFLESVASEVVGRDA